MEKSIHNRVARALLGIVPLFLFSFCQSDLAAAEVVQGAPSAQIAQNEKATVKVETPAQTPAAKTEAPAKAPAAKCADSSKCPAGTACDTGSKCADGDKCDEAKKCNVKHVYDNDAHCNTCASGMPRSPDCANKPVIGFHGELRLDVATMDRVPQFGSVIQPTTIQIPLDKQRENRHQSTYMDVRASTVSMDISHKVCDINLSGEVELGFGADLGVGGGGAVLARGFGAQLDKAYARADWNCGCFVKAGLDHSLITTETIAHPLDLPICDLYGPAGMTYWTSPQVRIGGSYKISDEMGDLNYFIGAEQQLTWKGFFSNGQIALHPGKGDALKFPLFAAGGSWEGWDIGQLDVRFGVSQNGFAIQGSREKEEKVSWFGKVTLQSKLLRDCSWWPTWYGSYTYMDGMGRFASLAFPDAVLTSDNEIENVKAHGVFTGSNTDCWGWFNCNTMFGWAWADDIDDSSFNGDMYNQYITGQICLWREFCESYVAAIEYKRWHVKSCNGDKGHENIFMGTLFMYF